MVAAFVKRDIRGTNVTSLNVQITVKRVLLPPTVKHVSIVTIMGINMALMATIQTLVNIHVVQDHIAKLVPDITRVTSVLMAIMDKTVNMNVQLDVNLEHVTKIVVTVTAYQGLSGQHVMYALPVDIQRTVTIIVYHKTVTTPFVKEILVVVHPAILALTETICVINSVRHLVNMARAISLRGHVHMVVYLTFREINAVQTTTIVKFVLLIRNVQFVKLDIQETNAVLAMKDA